MTGLTQVVELLGGRVVLVRSLAMADGGGVGSAAGSRSAGLVVARVGKVVVGCEVSLPWRVVDLHGVEVGVVSDFLRDVYARDFSSSSVRSYAQALLRWLRFLWVVELSWDRVGSDEVRDFVLWMRATVKPGRRRPGSPVPGSVNSLTGKRYLDSGFAPATINHNLAI